MARNEFIQHLRTAYRLLQPPKVQTDHGSGDNERLSKALDSADLWLSRRAVSGFNEADFADLPNNQGKVLANEVAAFLGIAEKVPPNKPARPDQSAEARKHLEAIIGIVREPILKHWLVAQENLIDEAKKAAKSKGWGVREEKKEVAESLLGKYFAPRLHIRDNDKEVVLDPVAYFGSGHQGVVDLAVMPTFEAANILSYKDGQWQIVTRNNRLPLTQSTLVNTITDVFRS